MVDSLISITNSDICAFSTNFVPLFVEHTMESAITFKHTSILHPDQEIGKHAGNIHISFYLVSLSFFDIKTFLAGGLYSLAWRIRICSLKTLDSRVS